MHIEAAKRAGELAKSVEIRQEKLAIIDQALAEHWKVVDVVAFNQVTGQRVSLILHDLDDASSQAGLGFIKQLYEAQLTSLEADLATAETWIPPGP